jgi:predicted metal-dependent peptidase
VKLRLFDLIRSGGERAGGYAPALQAARVRAAHERSYFAPALFNLVPVETDLIGSMAVDSHWRLYYNCAWLTSHTVEENASLLIHEVSHLVRDHEARRTAAGFTNHQRWNTAGDCEINDDLQAEGLPLPGDPPLPGKYGFPSGINAERYYQQLSSRSASNGNASEHDDPDAERDCGSGAHGERRFWERPPDDGTDGKDGGTPGVDRIKADLVRREVARLIDDTSPYDSTVPFAWRRWAHATLAPRVDYMATIRHVVRRGLRRSTLGRYDRTYARPHRRQACYGEFIVPSFYQPRPTPGFLIDTSGSMGDTLLTRAVSELASLTRQLGYGGEVVVACCDAAVHTVKKAFTGAEVELYGGGGTDLRVGLRAFVERKVDLLVVVSDCRTPWPKEAPPFPVITIRVGDGPPPPWGNHGGNKVVTIGDEG